MNRQAKLNACAIKKRFQPNIGRTGRIIRGVIGLILLGAASAAWRWYWLASWRLRVFALISAAEVQKSGIKVKPEVMIPLVGFTKELDLQAELVHRVGKHYGHERDRGHIKELLGVAGVGLTSQVVEGYARKLIGGLLGKAGGGLLRGMGRQADSSAMSFATTWALGRLAQQYYAGGREPSAIELRQLFGSLTEQARGLHAKYAGAIREKAGSLNLTQLLPMIRGPQ